MDATRSWSVLCPDPQLPADWLVAVRVLLDYCFDKDDEVKMDSKPEEMTSQKSPKRMWVKPELRHIKTGSAEVNTGTVDDGDPGPALNNS